ncbi:MAG TPA: hypothetical protein VIJ48_03290 [Acidimicrobiia bacterium]
MDDAPDLTDVDDFDDLDDLDDLDIGVVLADPATESEVSARWSEQLGHYVQGQGSLDALRLRSTTEPPWPHVDNPMVRYLIERTSEFVERDGIEAALAWLATHAWFEATIAERSRLARVLVDDY